MTDKQQAVKLLLFIIISVATIVLLYKQQLIKSSSAQFADIQPHPERLDAERSINKPEIKLKTPHKQETQKPEEVCSRIWNVQNVQKYEMFKVETKKSCCIN